jgi:TatD DNase family protein
MVNGLIDTHIHLDEEAYASDREELIARQRDSGVEAMIIPGVNASSISDIMNICHMHPGYCYAALGFHPQDVKDDWQEQWAVIEKAIRDNRDELVAIGEIGLDYYWDTSFKEEQHEIFRRQLELAQELDLPVMIHNREATEDTIKILQISNLKSQIYRPLRGVIHCFNGSRETAQQILDMGFYLGIGGVITFKNCKLADNLAGDERFDKVPLERIVMETDGPYLAPVPHRGERNESRFMIHVAERLAQVYNCTIEEIIATTNDNAKRLFRLK